MMSLRNIIPCYFCILLYLSHLTQGLPYSEMEEIIENEKEYNQNEAKRVEDFEVEKEYLNNEQSIGKIVDIAKDIIGAKYLGFFSSRSLKTRENYISFPQFVYFLRDLKCVYFSIFE